MISFSLGFSIQSRMLKPNVDSCYIFVSWIDYLLECMDSGCVVITDWSVLLSQDRCQDHYDLF